MVIAIIGLLAAIVLISLSGAKEKADEARGLNFSAQLKHGLGTALIGEWTFDNDPDDANILDSSGKGNNGYVVTGFLTHENGIVRKAARSSNINPQIEIPNTGKLDGTSGAFTIEFWIKTDPPLNGFFVFSSDNIHMIVQSSAVSSDIVFNCNTENLNFYDIVREFTFKVNRWYHIAATYDGKQTIQLYVNGKMLEPQSFGSSIDKIMYSGGNPYYIDMNENGKYMDEIRIYDSALKLSEIQKHYAQGLYKTGLAELR